ncbi:hypothetical protein V3N99_17095 [Dermatophilaceae bacterium Soc4.6]
MLDPDDAAEVARPSGAVAVARGVDDGVRVDQGTRARMPATTVAPKETSLAVE